MCEKQTDRELRLGLIFGTVLFVAWLVAVLLDSDRSIAGWLVRLLPLVLFAYCFFFECFREMISRRRKP
jgi:hypothetical protein